MGTSIIASFILLVMSCAGIDSAPCPMNMSPEWEVTDTASATALAKAINCSGGVFNVEWRGSIVVNRPLYIMDGTFVHVAGAGPGASMDGGGVTQLFNVMNSSLNVSNMQLTNGFAADGGAIAAEKSVIFFNATSFISNTAIFSGGAVSVGKYSTVSWEGLTLFQNNTAGSGGGAVSVLSVGSASWAAETSFYNNTAGDDGGAVFLYDGSDASWAAETTFADNTAMDGGVVYLEASTVSWEAKTSFYNNTAGDDGGAVLLNDGSSASWAAETSFYNNTAGDDGGAVFLIDGSSASWTAETTFADNTAMFGGAVYLWASTVSWGAKTSFSDNTANGSNGTTDAQDGYGGAMCVIYSNVSWDANTSFSDNTAVYGGAVYLYDSNVSWGAKTTFSENTGYEAGGAVYLFQSSVFWDANTLFSDNNAGSGGAVYATSFSLSYYAAGDSAGAVTSVSWDAYTSFSGNTANESGGALLVEENARVSWEAETYFLHNYAVGNGGAISVRSSMSTPDESLTSLSINGTTSFRNNRCGAGGGGMAMTGAVSVYIYPNRVSFSGNSAAVAGGAVFVSGVQLGPQFRGISFVSNSAQIGGGVYVTGSGTLITDYTELKDPTTFDLCEFIRNEAKATGGAVDTGAGQDVFVSTLFEGNSARAGGALRLAGTASLQDCTFVENTSDEYEGPTVSNIGYISSMSNISFVDNVFACQKGKFLDYGLLDVNLSTVCDGCETPCDEACTFEGKIPLCAEELGHSNSSGGNVTLEMLSIEKGYWRATNTSEDVLACYNADACLGGITGAADYCQHGYEGPYCSICSQNYTASLGFACTKCSDNDGGMVLVVVIAVLTMIAVAAFLFHMMSGEREGADRGIVARVTRYIPLQSLKIVIVVWQVLTQFSRVANVTYPDVYQKFLDGIDALNFDLSWILSAGCIFDVDFHERLLMSTIGPLIGTAILGATYSVAVRRNRGSSSSARGIVRQKHLSMVLLLTFVVYSSVSSTLFQMFACETLDDGKYYLRADYRIECDSSKHEALQIYAGFMIVLYTVGIPVFYATLLFTKRDVLTDGDGRKVDERVRSITDLWKPYKPDRFYYEVIECGRRILLTGVVVFIFPDTAPQVAVTILIAVFFMIVSETLAPFESTWDTWVNRMGHAVVFLSMYMALLLKVDLSNERASSQRIFEAILVSAHACMIAAVIIESIVLACALSSLNADTKARFRGGGRVSFAIEAEDDDA